MGSLIKHRRLYVQAMALTLSLLLISMSAKANIAPALSRRETALLSADRLLPTTPLPVTPDLLTPVPAQTGIQDKNVSVFGQNIHYLEAGTGPTVILLHGLGGNVTNWALTIPALATKYHVVVPDQIGFGKSDKPLIGYRIGTYIDFLDKLCSELKIDKATVVGNSLGGWIAAGFALKYPQRVERLVLVDAAGFALPQGFDASALTGLNPVTRDQMRAIISLMVFNKELFLNDYFVDQALAGRLGAGDGYTIDRISASLARGDDVLDGRLGGIKMPTLIIWGRNDGLLTLAEYGERFKREIPGAQMVIFEKCGHAPMLEKASEFNAALLKFLAE
ncbi:MAG: alpha/beta hydrolase [Pyrinomonadaceae bacterium]